MQHILDAILAGDTTGEEFAALDLPESYRARHRPQGRGRRCSRGSPARDKDPRKSLHVEDVAAPRARPRRGAGRGDGQRHQLQHRVDLDLRAGLDVRLPRALRPAVAARPSATTCRTTWSAPTWPASCSRPAPACTPGSPATEVVAHCLSVELESPDGHNDTMLDPEQRIWGFETNFGGLADVALVKSNQLMPKPAHLTWEEAASPGLVNSHRLPPAGQPQRRRHEAGRQRADLGRLRRPRRLRHAVRRSTAARRRSAWSPTRRRRTSAAAWARS